VAHGHHIFKGIFSPVSPARGAFMKAKQSIIVGHLHRASHHPEITADGEVISGNMGPGGSILVEKRMSDGEISIAGTLYEFAVTFTSADTESLPRTNLYYEARVTTSAGLNKTVSAGLFKAENTMIKDII